jgi:hypothetical protein
MKKNMTLLVCLYFFTCGRGHTHFPENLGFVIQSDGKIHTLLSPVALRPNEDRNLLIHECSRSHTMTHYSW